MIKYPLYFEGSVQAKSGVETLFEAHVVDYPAITCAIPEGFHGPGGGYSPEDLYLLAVVSCFVATFKVFAAQAKFAYAEMEGKGKLMIDRNEGGIPELKKLDMTFTLKGVQDEEKAKALLAEAEKFCLVSNAIKSEKSFNYSFE